MGNDSPKVQGFKVLPGRRASAGGISRLLTRVRRLWSVTPVAGYSRLRLPRDILLVSAWAPQERLVTSAFNLVSFLPSPLAVVMVDYTPGPKEWSSDLMTKRRVQEHLLGVRDLLAWSVMDVGVVCPALSVEIVVERSGVLEIRSGRWNEPRIVDVLEQSGLVETPHLNDRPFASEPRTLTAGDRRRLQSFREGLGLFEVSRPA